MPQQQPITSQSFKILLNMFFLACIIVLILVLFYSGEAYFNMLVSGLSLLFFSLLITSTQILSNNNDSSFQNTIKSIFPILLTLTSAAIFMYLLIKYKKNIIGDCNTTNDKILNSPNNTNDCISPDYSKFSFISILLLIFQMIIVYKSVSSQEFYNNGKLDNKMYSILFLIGIINLLVMLPMYTIVKYFTADG
jgi:hypothetical protein